MRQNQISGAVIEKRTNAISDESETKQETAAESAPPLKETTNPFEWLLRR